MAELDRASRVSRLGDYAEDVTGMGGAEWRTALDLVVRPRSVLDAYLKHGPTGGGTYARPTRFYLALCGVLMFYLFLIGGSERLIEQMPAAMLNDAIARSGKTREAFLNDADGWLSVVAIPVLSAFYALAIAPLMRWWGGTGWRIAFRATFALLCAWTVTFLPFGPLPYLERYATFAFVGMIVFLVAAFVRMGRGIWWTGPVEAAIKSVAIVVAMTIGGQIGMIPVFGIVAIGASMGS